MINNYNDLQLDLLFYNLYEVLPDETSILMEDSLYLQLDYLSHYYVRTKALKIERGKLYKLEMTYNEELKAYYYFTIPYGETVASGSTINYTWNSGDSTYTIQDQMQQNQQNQDELMGFLTSSDIPSGDQPTLQDISVPEVQDVTEDFFTWLMNSILNVLYNNNDSTLEVPLYNTTHYIRSDIYKLNIEPLKTFIQAGWWFIVGVPVLKYIRRSIERLKGGELPATDDKSDLLGNIL